MFEDDVEAASLLAAESADQLEWIAAVPGAVDADQESGRPVQVAFRSEQVFINRRLVDAVQVSQELTALLLRSQLDRHFVELSFEHLDQIAAGFRLGDHHQPGIPSHGAFDGLQEVSACGELDEPFLLLDRLFALQRHLDQLELLDVLFQSARGQISRPREDLELTLAASQPELGMESHRVVPDRDGNLRTEPVAESLQSGGRRHTPSPCDHCEVELAERFEYLSELCNPALSNEGNGDAERTGARDRLLEGGEPAGPVLRGNEIGHKPTLRGTDSCVKSAASQLASQRIANCVASRSHRRRNPASRTEAPPPFKLWI